MNYKLLFFACALDLFYYVPNLLASPIIGGQEDTSHAHKYHVSIHHKYNRMDSNSAEHLCGGTIIHHSYVLSVAHTFLTIKDGFFEKVYYPKRNGIVVLSGTSETYGSSGFISHVDKILIPREYNQEKPVYGDISLLKLSHDLDVERHEDRLQILRVNSEHHSLDFFDNKKAVILGNGYDTLEEGNDGVFRPLPRPAIKRRFIEVQMTPRASCGPEIFDYTICAVNHDDPHIIRTACKGDSGSPLVFGDTVIGVVSLGPVDCNSRSPILIARTSTFLDFIRKVMDESINFSQIYVLQD